MKLNKEEIQKIVLGVLGVVGVLYCYKDMLLGPLNRREAGYRAQISANKPKLEQAKAQIRATQTLEAQSPAVANRIEEIRAMIPDGAPVAWFPPQMVEFFKRQGIERCGVRLNTEEELPRLPGYKRLHWTIDLPKVSFVSLGIAVAGLENEHPLLEITRLRVEATNEDPEFQKATLTVATIVKQ